MVIYLAITNYIGDQQGVQNRSGDVLSKFYSVASSKVPG
jgi:hypothetical protein